MHDLDLTSLGGEHKVLIRILEMVTVEEIGFLN